VEECSQQWRRTGEEVKLDISTVRRENHSNKGVGGMGYRERRGG